MTKERKRFDIPDDEDLPESRLLRKFEVGGKSATDKKDENTLGRPPTKAASLPVETSPKAQKSPDVVAATPFVEPASTKPASQQPPPDEFIIVPFTAGVPAQHASRHKDILSASSMSEAYLMDYLFPRAIKLMEAIDMKSITVETDGPKTIDPVRSKRLKIKTSMLDKFRAAHDPLEVFKIVDCVRYIYIAAFDVALNELAAKLKI